MVVSPSRLLVARELVSAAIEVAAAEDDEDDEEVADKEASRALTSSGEIQPNEEDEEVADERPAEG